MDELLEELINSYTPEELVILLEIASLELLERFPEKIQENMFKFRNEDEL